MANVLVRHSAYDGKTRQAKPKIQEIKHFYMGGKVSTSTGDVWDVKPSQGNGYSYTTVAAVDK